MFSHPSSSFGIILNGSLITDLKISQKDTIGISVEQTQIPGCITMYEEHLVRTDIGYTIKEWYNLKPEERALEVAVSRIKNSIEYQKNKEQERRIEQQSNRRK